MDTYAWRIIAVIFIFYQSTNQSQIYLTKRILVSAWILICAIPRILLADFYENLGAFCEIWNIGVCIFFIKDVCNRIVSSLHIYDLIHNAYLNWLVIGLDTQLNFLFNSRRLKYWATPQHLFEPSSRKPWISYLALFDNCQWLLILFRC